MPGNHRWHVQTEPTGSNPVTTTRLLTVFGIVDIAVGIAVWAATGNAVVGIVIVLVGIMLLVVPAVRVKRPEPAQGRPPRELEGQQPSESFGKRPSEPDQKRASKSSEAALDKTRAEQQRLRDETAAEIENVEDRPPPTGA